MTPDEAGSSASRAIEVGVILAAVQGRSRACQHFRAVRQTSVAEHLLTDGTMPAWTVADGTKLLDVLRLLHWHQVSAAEMLIRDDPKRTELLERGYESGRDQYEATPPFAEAGIRRILELLAKHFPPSVELDGMIATVEARLLDAMVPYFAGQLEKIEQLERWDARSSLRHLRERIEAFRRELCDGDWRQPLPALTQLIVRLEAAERRAAEWPSGLLQRGLFQASTEYRSGRHDTRREVVAKEYEPFAEEMQCVPSNGQRVRAFRLFQSFGLLTLADVHFHIQANMLKRAGFLPRLGVDYVLRAACAKAVNVLTCHPAILAWLLRYRMYVLVRTDAPYFCVSTRGLDPLDRLGIPRAAISFDRGADGPWVHYG